MHGSDGLNRRQALRVLGAGGVAVFAAGLVTPMAAAAEPAPAGSTGGRPAGPPDDVAATYHRVLLRHTRWAESQFDAAKGIYPATDFTFAVVLGNAVLLTRDGYDASVTGVSQDVLHKHTVDTIRHFAASNLLTGGTEWGKRLFFDTTFQSYFQLAARLLWTDLDDATRANVEKIATEQAAYTTALGTGNDPMSGDWTPHGLTGGYVGDTKLEEMGVYAQSLAPGLAWAPGDPRAAAWRSSFGAWSRNEGGLPAADLANPRLVDGIAVSANTATNLYDTFLVENHGSFGPHYQEELWRTSGRNSMHFLLSGQPLPEVLTAQPNGELLWRTMLLMTSDAGEPLMPMVNDREHLYGRDVIPLAFRAQVLGDRYAARAEADLAARLEPYQAYPPVDRVTKFSGEPKYEPEARAEIAISYLLHEWRASHGGTVRPVSVAEFDAHALGVADFGTGPGLVAHRSPAAWAATVTKPGFVKFAWQPHHDDWLFALSGATPMFLPSTALAVRERHTATWTKVRDGFDGSVGVLKFDTGYAGFATLPTGAAVYASTGVADGEGVVSVYNLDMPGMPGLDGGRTYRAAEGTVTVPVATAPPAGGRVDDLVFPAVTARYVRMLGVQPDPAYGYSLWAFEVRDGASGADLARAGTATASSAAPGKEAKLATDGDPATRWAVSTADRPRADSWLAVDLGAPQAFDRVRLSWEAAAGRKYRVETSADGVTWAPSATYPKPALTTTGGWLDVDGRAGFVVSGSERPITVSGDRLALADGPVAPMLVECYPDPRDLAAVSRGARPASSAPSVRASVVDGHLVLLNLSGAAATTVVSLPQPGGSVALYRGEQVVTAGGSDLTAALAPAEGRIEPAWFTLRGAFGRAVPARLRATVSHAAELKLTAPAGAPMLLTVQPAGEPARTVTVPGGRTVTVTARQTRPYPLDDLALGAVTFPAEPLPQGMSSPGAAVDDNPATAWHPGANGRMVVDLGAVVPVAAAELSWAPGRIPTAAVEYSTDGRTYTAAPAPGRGRTVSVPLKASARYVAVRVTDSRPGAADLTRLSVRG
ncbi:discoidin domain-containing protein [Amycolatopsis saalfeldensis]|uniref:F5/8 type C domain-containing protein n=1 Tax=Amycolatopsis saalfeldensis TaxID=394193 RepID=A0A1H8YK43_9PSEU|nr:discoidin domain-containing protein [Amycolatopsis saalfeldensis]SEP52517.1 F5/8 type C domain-containing protein [Amycolatopsis saalfeldensis]